jgi:hypothetical protein
VLEGITGDIVNALMARGMCLEFYKWHKAPFVLLFDGEKPPRRREFPSIDAFQACI